MRPPGPVPGTNCNSMPSSHARRRTAGEAIGFSPGARQVGDSVVAGGGATGCDDGGAAAGGGGVGLGCGVGDGAGFAATGALAAAVPPPSTSMRISSAPTAITSPMLPPREMTLPFTGEGISTVALSVITSATAWSSSTVSPGFTCQPTSSTSAIPSPMSGILITWMPMSGLHRSLERLADPLGAGEVGPLLRVRVRRVPSGDAFDRGFQVIEAVLLHQRGQFRAEPAGPGGLVHDHAAARLLH